MASINAINALSLYNASINSQKLIKRVEAMIFDGNFDTEAAMRLLAEASDELNSQQIILGDLVCTSKVLERNNGVVLVDDLEMSQRAINLLKRNGLFTLVDLVKYMRTHSLDDIQGCGVAIKREVNSALRFYIKQNGRYIKQRSNVS